MASDGSSEPASSPDTGDSPPPPTTSPPPPERSSPPPPSKESSPTPLQSLPPPPPSLSPPPSSPPPSLSPPPSSPPPSLSPPPSSPPPSSSPLPPSPPPTNNSSPPPPPDSSNQSPPPGNNNSSPPPPSVGSTTPSPPPPYLSTNSPTPEFSPPPPVVGSTYSPPPPVDGSSSSPESSPSSTSLNSDHNAAIIFGAAVAGAFLFIMLIVCLVCSRRKKRKHAAMPHSWDSNLNQFWSSNQGMDHSVKIAPPPGGTAGGGWRQPGPQPPPHMMGDSDETNSPYSGVNKTPLPPPSPGLSIGFSKNAFSYEELAAATDGFAQSNMLGQGGFGFVHKGVLPNGKEVAVKSLKSGSGQGEREFRAEVEIISRVHHRHLVSLVGYCIAGGQRMLVYEFVPNNNLEYHLHKRGDPPLDFSTRLQIALGSAKGLAYLHEDCHPRIIHRDIKASNILLDYHFEAKVADFGLAKLTSDTNTHVSTRVMGTFGYLAPEYASSGKLTEKSDVFSYGVMLLELITGRRPVDPKMSYMEDSLVDWSRPLLSKAVEDGNFDELADPWLERNYDAQEMARMVACAAACIRHSAKKRPKMSQIVRALEGDASLDDLNEDVRTARSITNSSSDGSSDHHAGTYSADLRKFRQTAFGSQELGSGLHDGNTSEYGLNPSTSSDSSREFGPQKIALN